MPRAGTGHGVPVRRGGDAEGAGLGDRLAQQVDQRVADARVLDAGGREEKLHAASRVAVRMRTRRDWQTAENSSAGPEVRESRPCRKHSSRTPDRGSRPSPRAGSSSTCATPSGGSRRGGARGAPSRTSTATRRSSSPSSGSTSPSWSPGRQPLPRRGEPGGVPRPLRGVRAARRGRGAAPAALGLLPRSPVDRARLRGRGRGAVRDPDGRFALGPGSALPGVGARRALRRERGGGDLRLEAGVRDGRVVPARAAAELGSSALGVGWAMPGRIGCASPRAPRPTRPARAWHLRDSRTGERRHRAALGRPRRRARPAGRLRG